MNISVFWTLCGVLCGVFGVFLASESLCIVGAVAIGVGAVLIEIEGLKGGKMTVMNKNYAITLNGVVDCYDLIDALGIESAALQHAFKKIAYTGVRGHKNERQDIEEAIQALQRRLEQLGAASEEALDVRDRVVQEERERWKCLR